MSHRYRWVSPWLLATALLVGCAGSTHPDRLPTEPVTVRVKYNGAPVEGATVTFISTGEKPLPAIGRTDAQGMAKLKTYVDGDGAVIGSHKVIIYKSEITNAPPEAPPTESPEYDPSAPSPVPDLKNLLPAKYAQPDTSGLTAEVISGAPLEMTFELAD